MNLDQNWRPRMDGDFKDIISTDSRKLIIEKTKVAKSNLVNYFKDFFDKQLLVKNNQGGTEINSFLMARPENGVLEINLILQCYEQSEEK